jgi:hypothetical protein
MRWTAARSTKETSRRSTRAGSPSCSNPVARLRSWCTSAFSERLRPFVKKVQIGVVSVTAPSRGSSVLVCRRRAALSPSATGALPRSAAAQISASRGATALARRALAASVELRKRTRPRRLSLARRIRASRRRELERSRDSSGAEEIRGAVPAAQCWEALAQSWSFLAERLSHRVLNRRSEG